MLKRLVTIFLPLLLLVTTALACITGPNPGLNPKVVQATIVARYPNIQKCYTKSIGDEGHAGVLKSDFLIDKNGRAKSIRLIDESLGTNKLNSCLQKEIEALTFPKPKGGVDVAVSYPFQFEADTKLTQAAVMGILKGVNTSLCYEEIARTNDLKVKLTIGRLGRVQKTTRLGDDTELKASSPCLSRTLQKQKFPRINSRQFQTVSVVVTFQADTAAGASARVSQTR